MSLLTLLINLMHLKSYVYIYIIYTCAHITSNSTNASIYKTISVILNMSMLSASRFAHANTRRTHLRAGLHLHGADLSEVSVQNVLALKPEFTALALEVFLLEHGHPKRAPVLQLLLRIHDCCRSLSIRRTRRT